MSNLGLDPVAIRASLEVSRAQGLSFTDAWREATGRVTEDPAVVTFMMKHFRAAYDNTDRREGRCMVPERDVSSALRAVPEGRACSGHKRCQSGDGCEREATHGRHGKTWCEYHFEELERIRVAYEASVARAAARNPMLRQAA